MHNVKSLLFPRNREWSSSWWDTYCLLTVTQTSWILLSSTVKSDNICKSNGQWYWRWIQFRQNTSGDLLKLPTRKILHLFTSSCKYSSRLCCNVGQRSDPCCSSQGIFPPSSDKTHVSMSNSYRSRRWSYCTNYLRHSVDINGTWTNATLLHRCNHQRGRCRHFPRSVFGHINCNKRRQTTRFVFGIAIQAQGNFEASPSNAYFLLGIKHFFKHCKDCLELLYNINGNFCSHLFILGNFRFLLCKDLFEAPPSKCNARRHSPARTTELGRRNESTTEHSAIQKDSVNSIMCAVINDSLLSSLWDNKFYTVWEGLLSIDQSRFFVSRNSRRLKLNFEPNSLLLED